MDWLATKLPQNLRGSVWMDLAGPPSQHQPGSANASSRQQLELGWIDKVLTDDGVRADLLTYVGRALRLSTEQVEIVAWEAPRSLLMHVLPTLRRRLASSWSRDGEPGSDYQVKYQPLPDFVPSNLFSDLNLPETLITLPPAQRNAEETETQSPVLQALRTFAPGRISRRFGVEHRFVRHWVPVPLDAPAHAMDLDSFADGSPLGHFDFLRSDGTIEHFEGLRPWTIRTERPPKHLLDSSNSMLEWRSQFDPLDLGDGADIPSPSPWDGVVTDLRTFTHARRSGLDLTRLAIGTRATVLLQSGEEREVNVSFNRGGSAAALGFRLDVDAIRVDAFVPEFFGSEVAYQSDGPSLRSFRSSYFQALVCRDPQLLGLANAFQLQWLAQLFLSSAVERAILNQISLAASIRSVPPGDLGIELQRILTVIFEAGPAVGEEEVESTGEDAPRQRLHQRLVDLSDDPSIIHRLVEHSTVLWDEPDDGWRRWATERFAATLGAALLEGTDRLCRDVGAQNLVLDTSVDHGAGVCRIWLSEPTIGGGGIVEEFARRYSEDPRRFFRLVEAALAPSDFEIVDSELSRALDFAVDDDVVRDHLTRLRAAPSHDQTRAALRELIGTLVDRGLAVSHPVVAALNARVLRPGSSHESDRFLRGLIHQWRAEEERLGVEIDARVFAYAASTSEDADQLIGSAPVGASRRQWRFATIYGLLWPRGAAVRASSLQVYNPYHQAPPTDRVLVLSSLRATAPEVRLDSDDWRAQMATALISEGAAMLRARPEDARALREAIIELLAVPIDAGYLMLHPRVIGFARGDGDLLAHLEMREAFQ